MNTRILFAVLIFLLSTCKGYDDIAFDPTLIPGEYTGWLSYYTSAQGGGTGDHVPDLSKSYEYKTIITKAGSNYTLLFDKSFKYTIPDLSIEITTVLDNSGISKIAMIRPVAGQEYSLADISIHPLTANFPVNTNYINVSTINRIVFGYLELKSNDPDSVYFLHLHFGRSY